MVDDKATEIVAEPSVPITEVTMVPVDVTVDPSIIPASQVEDAVEETSIPETDAGTKSVQPKLTAPNAEEIFGESPSHDSQHAMEGEAENGDVLPTSPIRNLIGEEPNSAEVIPLEGILPFSYIFTIRNTKCK